MTYEEIKSKVLAWVPEVCPVCGGKLTLSDDLMHLTCDNPDCGGKVYRRLEIAAKALGIDNIGQGVAKELCEHLGITNVWQLFDLSVDDFKKVPRYQDGMANRLYDSVHAVDSVPFANFIRACQFRRIGDGSANDLAQSFDSLDAFLGASEQSVAKVLGVRSSDVSGVIWGSVVDSRDAALKLADRVRIVYPEKKASRSGGTLTCVVTGPLGFGPRPEFQKVFGESYGVKWASAVSKNTDYLVTNETAMTGKFKKAKELIASGGKVKIVTEAEFMSIIGAGDTASERMAVTAEEAKEVKSYDGLDVQL